jgi:hypothetical protein
MSDTDRIERIIREVHARGMTVFVPGRFHAEFGARATCDAFNELVSRGILQRFVTARCEGEHVIWEGRRLPSEDEVAVCPDCSDPDNPGRLSYFTHYALRGAKEQPPVKFVQAEIRGTPFHAVLNDQGVAIGAVYPLPSPGTYIGAQFVSIVDGGSSVAIRVAEHQVITDDAMHPLRLAHRWFTDGTLDESIRDARVGNAERCAKHLLEAGFDTVSREISMTIKVGGTFGVLAEVTFVDGEDERRFILKGPRGLNMHEETLAGALRAMARGLGPIATLGPALAKELRREGPQGPSLLTDMDRELAGRFRGCLGDLRDTFDTLADNEE